MKPRSGTKGKRGSGTTITLETIMFLVVAIPAIIFISGGTSNIWGITRGGGSDLQLAINNFDHLSNTFQELEKSREPYITVTTTYYLPKDYVLVGFDKAWNRIAMNGDPHAQEGDTSGPIIKPLRCGDHACLCLYADQIEENVLSDRDKNVIDCRSFDSDIVMLSLFTPDEEPRFCGTKRNDITIDTTEPALDKAEYGYFIAYGDECGTWKSQKLHLEKIDRSGIDPTLPLYLIGGIIDQDSAQTIEDRDKALEKLTPPVTVIPFQPKPGNIKSVTQITQQWLPSINQKLADLGRTRTVVITPDLVIAVMTQESANDPHAISYTGAVGLMQFTSGTARDISIQKGYPGTFDKNHIMLCNCGPGSDAAGVCLNPKCDPTNDDRFDPDKSLTAGIAYLNKIATQELKQYQSSPDFEKFVLLGYNAGPGLAQNVLASTGKANPSWNDVLAKLDPNKFKVTEAKIKEITSYVQRIMAYQVLAANEIASLGTQTVIA